MNEVKRSEYFQMVSAAINGFIQRPEKLVYGYNDIQQITYYAMQGVEYAITQSGGQIVND